MSKPDPQEVMRSFLTPMGDDREAVLAMRRWDSWGRTYTAISDMLSVAEAEARGLLAEAADWMDEDGCDCGTPGDVPCVLCRVRAFLAASPAPTAYTKPRCQYRMNDGTQCILADGHATHVHEPSAPTAEPSRCNAFCTWFVTNEHVAGCRAAGEPAPTVSEVLDAAAGANGEWPTVSERTPRETHAFDAPGGPMKGTNIYLCRRIAGRGFCLKPESDPIHDVPMVTGPRPTQQVLAGVSIARRSNH